MPLVTTARRRLLGLLLGRLGSNAQLTGDPVPSVHDILLDLSKDGLGRRGRAVLEVRVLAAGQGAQLVGRRPLRHRHPEAVEVRLELALAPRLKQVCLGRVGRLGEVAGCRRVRRAAGRRGRGVGRLGRRDQLVTGRTRLLADLLGRRVAARRQVVAQVLVAQVVPSPGRPAASRLVGMLADKSTQLVGLAPLGYGLA